METKKENSIQFAEGISIYEPHQNAPDFIKGDVVITEEFLNTFKKNCFKNTKGVNQMRMNLNLSKKGTLYLSINDYRPQPKEQEQINQIEVQPEQDTEDLPF